MNKKLENFFINSARKDAALFSFIESIEFCENEKCATLASFIDKENKMIIEYHPKLLDCPEAILYDYFLLECYRLMMNHHNARIINANKDILYIASNLTLIETLELKLPMVKIDFEGHISYGLRKKEESLEEWYRELMKMKPENIQNNYLKFANRNKGKPKSGDEKGENQTDKQENKPKESNKHDPFEPKNASKNAQNWSAGNLDESEKKLEKMNNNIAEKVNLSKGCSTMSSKAMDRLTQCKGEKYNCRVLLKRFIQSVEDDKKKETRTRPHRRFDLDAPGKIVKQKVKIIVGLDTSGSIYDSDLETFKDVLVSMINQVETDVICWGSNIIEKSFKKFKELKGSVKEYRTYDGGGTNPENFLFWAVENNYNAAVVLTDGDFSSSIIPEQWKLKVAWVLTSGGLTEYLTNYRDVYRLEELV